MSVEEMPDTGRYGPILVAAIVVGILIVTRPLESELAGISLNLIAVIVVALGGIMGTLS